MQQPPKLITLFLLLIPLSSLFSLSFGYGHANSCRSYCGNITIDYPFGVKYGCGHPGYRDLLYCINDVLMFHISSGSYQVLDIDYTFQALTLHDPHLSTCNTIVLETRGNGFVVEPWRKPYLAPTPDNAFLLLGCSRKSSLFQGFPSNKHLPCRNVSGLGCEEYYRCPAWGSIGPTEVGLVSGLGPPECCAVAFEEVESAQGVNLTKLECQAYSSVYNLAPLRVDGPHEWSYGIRVKYTIQGHDEFCKACEATRGTCGYKGVDESGITELCMCDTWNSTTNCESTSVESMTSNGVILRGFLSIATLLTGFHFLMIWWSIS